MQLESLFSKFDALQKIHGDPDLDAIYGCGETSSPKVCLVFMNPTAKNISAQKSWTGLKAPWLGTKHVWKMLCQLGLIDRVFVEKIAALSPTAWTETFAREVYGHVKKESLYITNLSKATQVDARHLPDSVFREYVELFKEEMKIIKPKVIITFGNQVSSIVLDHAVKISEYRRKSEDLEIAHMRYKVFPVYYPVGQGMRNMAKAREDLAWILKEFSLSD